MTWAKVSDTFNDDPALIGLPRGVRLLYVELTTWSCRHGTDGHIPAAAPRRISDEDDIVTGMKALVEAGLLDELDDGWMLSRFAAEQVSADEVERKQASNRARQERRRRHLSGDHSQCNPDQCDQAARDGNALVTRDDQRDVTRDKRVSHGHLTRLTRPDPPDPTRLTRQGQDGEGSHATARDDGASSAAPPPAVRRCEHGAPLAADGSGCELCPPPVPAEPEPRPRAEPKPRPEPRRNPLYRPPAPDDAPVELCPTCGLLDWECRELGHCPEPVAPQENPCEPPTSPSAKTPTPSTSAADSAASTATSPSTSPPTDVPPAATGPGCPADPAATAPPASTSPTAATNSRSGRPRDQPPRNGRAGSRAKRTRR